MFERRLGCVYLRVGTGSFGWRRLGARRSLFSRFGQVPQHDAPLHREAPAESGRSSTTSNRATSHGAENASTGTASDGCWVSHSRTRSWSKFHFIGFIVCTGAYTPCRMCIHCKLTQTCQLQLERRKGKLSLNIQHEVTSMNEFLSLPDKNLHLKNAFSSHFCTFDERETCFLGYRRKEMTQIFQSYNSAVFEHFFSQILPQKVRKKHPWRRNAAWTDVVRDRPAEGSTVTHHWMKMIMTKSDPWWLAGVLAPAMLADEPN